VKHGSSHRRIRASLARASLIAGQAGLSLLPCTAVLSLVGCAGTTQSASSPQPNAQPDALTILKNLAQREQSEPNSAAMQMAPAPGIDIDSVRALPESQLRPDSPALLSLDDAIKASTATFVLEVAPPRTPDEQLDTETLAEALKLYASGVKRLNDGNIEAAMADLMQAKTLDPRSPSIWVAIGDAYVAAGRRPSGLGAWQQAIRQGSQQARIFAALGREALRSRRLDTAVGLLNAARNCKDASDDPAMLWLLNADLGEALADLGHLDSARRLLATLQSMPPVWGQPTRLRNEIADLYRRRAELLQRTGDLSMRLGRADDASESYAAAAMWSSIDPGAVLLRRVDVLARLGRPAQGSLVLLEDIARSKGQIDERQLALIRWLSSVDGLAKPLADGLGQLQQELGPQLGASASAGLLRARASALEGEPARVILRQHLAAHPADAEALGELLARTDDSPSARGNEIATLANANPQLAETYAETLIAQGSQILRTIGALESANGVGSRLTAAHALQKLGLAERSWANVESIGKANPAALADRAELAAKLGRYEAAAQALGSIPPDHPSELAISLRSLQRFSDAFNAIAPVANGPDATPQQLMLAAELSLRTGRFTDTERYLRAVLQKSPGNDQAAQSLISLYSPPSPLANDDKLASLVRSLREAEPSSRLIRQLAARELLQRGLWAQAETAFISIAEQSVPLPDDVNSLVTAWERQSSNEQTGAPSTSTLDRAQRWLGRKLEAHPDSPWLIAGLARIQAAAGDATKADAFLAERIKSLPVPDLARLREQIVRASLGRPEDADEMTIQRLATMPPTIDTAIERAEALVRAGRGVDAADALRKALPGEVPLSAEQASRLASLISKSVQDELLPQPAGGLRALSLMDLATERGLNLSPNLLDARLALLARQRPGNRDELLATVKAIGASEPERAEAAVRRAAQTLFAASDRRGTLTLLIAAFPAITTPASELVQSTVGLAGQVGEPADVPALLEAIGSERLISYIQSQAQLGLENFDAKAAAVETVHQLGNLATNAGRDEIAEGFYREALKLDPDHAMTNNNLGYFLLDAGQKLEDAAKFIERAYASNPDAANIIDSLAWLRYKQGVIIDRVASDGKVELQGAISLLERASELEGDNNDEMLDHLGDANFKAGRSDEAKRRWQQALELMRGQIEYAEAQLREINERRPNDPVAVPPALERMRTRVGRITDKVTALAAGKDPKVADSGVIPAPPVHTATP
jgi:tetratricopeptide (TPR) repeat protein